MNWSLVIGHWSFRFVRLVAQEALPVLLILYPTLLLLDSLEPGFVRSVVNPHAFLLAVLVVGTLASLRERGVPSVPGDGRTVAAHGSVLYKTAAVHNTSPRWWGAGVAGIVGGLWVWWSIGGRFGIPIAILAGVAIAATVLATDSRKQSE